MPCVSLHPPLASPLGLRPAPTRTSCSIPLRALALAGVAVGAVMLQACALKAPAYAPALENVEAMKRSGMRSVSLGSFTLQAGAVGGTEIGLRGGSMSSPVGSDYAAYLAEALRAELSLAGKLDPKSNLEISGVLLKNDIAAAGLSVNSGEVEARFVVKRDGAVRYQAVKRSELSWDSHFLGSIAIPKAQQQYPLLVQRLVGLLLADPSFMEALK